MGEMQVWNLLTWNVTTVLTLQVAMLTPQGMCLRGGPLPLSVRIQRSEGWKLPSALPSKSDPVLEVRRSLETCRASVQAFLTSC